MDSSSHKQDQLKQAAPAALSYLPLTRQNFNNEPCVTASVYFFLRSPDITRMKSALTAALDRHPPPGVGMVREASTVGPYCGSSSAEFSVHYSDEKCPDFKSTQSLFTGEWLQTRAVSNHSPLDCQTASYRPNSDWPMPHFRLILFRDRSCALLLHHVNSQVDVSAAMLFLQNGPGPIL
jgi:hypothetical protein